MNPIIGVDFSGAVDAGRKIWIATAHHDQDRLRIDDLRQAAHLPGGALARDAAFSALCTYITAQSGALIGCDFPFSLAHTFVPDGDWETFACAFRGRYPTPENFYAQMGAAAAEAKAAALPTTRTTDRIAKTPFAPHNLRLYRQTYHGIADVLAPLVRADAARVLPMQSYHPARPTLIEICPASFLKRIAAYHPYKGKSATHEAQRRAILMRLQDKYALEISNAYAKRIYDEPEGDALDSVVAAVATSRSIEPLHGASPTPIAAIEGWVYIGA